MAVSFRSLRTRTIFFLFAAVLTSEMMTFGAMALFRERFLNSRGHELVDGYVSLVKVAIVRSSPQQAALDLEHNPGPGLRLIQHPPLPPGLPWPPPPHGPPPPDMPDPHGLADDLRMHYGENAVRFSSTAIGSQLWVRVAADDWWLKIPLMPLEVPVPWTIIAGIGAGVALISLLSMWFVAQVSRPLRALAQAASAFEPGQLLQLPLTGPDEVRAVTSQFNAMTERLAHNDAERRVMLAGLPHDLRAPLARAKLRMEMMDDGSRAGLERDLREIERIADQFVNFLRASDGAASSRRFEPTDMAKLIQERAGHWQAPGQSLQCGRLTPSKLDIDTAAMERAIDNLVANAFAHGVQPVEISSRIDAGNYAISVSDRGPGIPANMREAALRPFVRLDPARGANASAAREGGHCGLGLAVAQAVARMHDGRIDLGDAPGGGLTATIVLPLAPRTN